MKEKQVIFYGAGDYAAKNLDLFLQQGLRPVCFSDADTSKHYSFIGEYQILPLREALLKWPDLDICITLSSRLLEVTQFLLAQHIPKEKICYTQDVKYRKSCTTIGTELHFINNPTDCFFCCKFLGNSRNNPYIIPYSNDDFEGCLEKVDSAKYKVLQSHIDGNPVETCVNCGALREDLFPATPKIATVSFGSNEDYVCNYKCIYCSGCNKYIDNILPVLRNLASQERFDKVRILLAKGELTFRRDCDEILDFIAAKKWDVDILTNGSILKEKICQMARTGMRVFMNCSLDAGTKSTYAAIKGVDCYAKTISNLEKYHDSGVVLSLKYLLVDGLNTNKDDMDGFFAVTDKLQTPVLLSNDNRSLSKQLSNDAVMFAKEFVYRCKERDYTDVHSALFKNTILRNFNEADSLELMKIL